ncbi:MAG: demethoxyubiquinone hydroxylase family protein [Gammaproteobacteria bacterium]|nr:demethoxyubiquinone hydroxylase family protein [Gammaproteobacteria bacterium]
MRSDHAGEAGAVAIYRGILAVSRDADVRDFAARHIETESRHLALMEQLVPGIDRSSLLALWLPAGYLLGAVPALFGARAVYATIGAVETFVDGHYQEQLDRLAGLPEWAGLHEQLSACRDDELQHRDEAWAHVRHGALSRFWTAFIGAGSAVAVALARRF